MKNTICAYCCCSINKINNTINLINNILSSQNTKYIKVLSIAISFIFVFPLLYANYYFNDDLVRAISGYVGWDILGRPLAAYISEIFTLDHYVIDISPLPLLLSVIVLSASINLIVKNIQCEYSLRSALIVSLAIISPCILQNLGYRYDCLGMVLSIFTAIISWKYTLKDKILNTIASAVFFTISLSFYQPSSFVSISLITISACLYFIDNKNIIKYTCKSGISVIAGLLIYYLLIQAQIIKTNNRSDLIFSLADWPFVFERTALRYISLFKETFPTAIIILIIASTIIAVGQLIYTGFQRIGKKNTLQNITETGFCLLSVSALFLLTFTPMSLLSEGLCDARTATCFSFFVMGVFIILNKLKQYLIKCFALISTCLILLVTLVTSFAAGSGMSNQKLFDQAVMTSVITTLESNKLFYNRQSTVYGQTSQAQPVTIIAKAFPFTNRMIHRIYDYSGHAYLSFYGIDSYFDRNKGHEMAEEIYQKQIAPTISNNNFSIFIINNVNFIWLGDHNCKIKDI